MNDLQDRLGRDLAELAQRGPAPRLTTTDVLGRVQQRRRRRAVARSAAAFGLVAVVIAGVAAITGRRATNAPVNNQPVSTQPDSPFVAAVAPPLIALDVPGWHVDRFDDNATQPAVAIYVDSVLGFAGPWFVIEHTTDGTPTDRTVDVGGSSGGITGAGGFRMLVWETPDGKRYRAMSRDVPEDQLIAAAGALQVNPDGTASSAAPPAGMILAVPDANQLLNRYAEYQISNGASQLQVSFYSGGRLEVRTAGEQRESVQFNGHTASLINYATDGAPGTYRLDLVDGFWVWEINGDGFADRNAFLDLAAHVAVVDEATWKATLPPDAVTKDERPTAVNALLTGIPLPPNFDAASLQSGSTKDQYQLTAEVTGAVFCAWLRDWNSALDSGDSAGADAAVQAISSSHGWPALTSMTGGDWNKAVWQYADRVATGDRAVVTEAVNGLNCAA